MSVRTDTALDESTPTRRRASRTTDEHTREATDPRPGRRHLPSPRVALRGLVTGRPEDPRWTRPALLALLVVTAVLYCVDLGSSGRANAFYSAAAQAGARSWEAFFFGSSDLANAITVDKAPGALWVMDLFARCFGVNAWSILLPQALAGIASVALLYATVRRSYTPAAGLIAGAMLALTPVATLMFRYDNPDALLVLVLVGAAYCLTRASERAGAGWLVAAGALLGYGFLVKMLQAFLVVPAFAAVYLLVAPTGVWRRVGHLLAAGVAMVISAGWWVLAVALTPAADRPYIGGSQRNSVLELALGYNGFGRLSGDETGGLGNTNQDAGWSRLLGEQMGTQIGWLLPAALLALGAGLWITRRAPSGDRQRAGLLLWGGWLVVTGVVFSFARGIVHPYYTVALAPAIGALCGIGAVLVWRRRAVPAARIVLAGTVAIGAVLASVLLARADWQGWLGVAIPLVGLTAAVLLLMVHRLPRPVIRGVVVAALVAGAAAPAAYSVATVGTPHSGAIPTAGPAGAGMGMHGMHRHGAHGGAATGIGGAGPAGGVPGATGNAANGNGAGQRGGAFAFGPRGHHGGGMFGSPTPGKQLTALLRANAERYTWTAATIGSDNAAGYQLDADAAVMPLGGYNGTDPSPTPAQFQADVRAGRIHYYIDSRVMGMHTGARATGSHDADRIASWVRSHFRPRVVDGVTIYDLSQPTGTHS